MTAVNIIISVIVAINVVLLGFTGFILALNRNKKIVSNRSIPLLILQWFGMLNLTLSCYITTIGLIDCESLIIIRCFLPDPLIVLFVRCLRLYLLCTKHEKTVDSHNSHNKILDYILHPWYSIVLLYVPVHIITIIIPIVNFFIGLSKHEITGPLFDIGSSKVNTSVCQDTSSLIGFALVFLIYTVGSIISIVKLWNVYDLYYIKKEFKIISAPALIIGLLALTNAILSHDDLPNVKGIIWSVTEIVIMFCNCVMFLWPSLLILAKKSEGTSGSISDIQVEEVTYDKTFILNKYNYDSIERYIREYITSNDMRVYLYHSIFLLQEIYTYEETKRQELLLGKAILINQKFLLPNSFLFVSSVVVSDTSRNEITFLLQLSEKEELNLHNDFFVTIKEQLEEFLKVNLIEPYLQSKEYSSFRKKSVLMELNIHQETLDIIQN